VLRSVADVDLAALFKESATMQGDGRTKEKTPNDNGTMAIVVRRIGGISLTESATSPNAETGYGIP
jgi:hypothetical protein